MQNGTFGEAFLRQMKRVKLHSFMNVDVQINGFEMIL
jgi:hypothetical protein